MNVILVGKECRFCAETVKAIIQFNSTRDPEDWVEIVDADLGDPRIRKIRAIVGKTIPTPTGMINGTFVNFVIDTEHFLNFLENII